VESSAREFGALQDPIARDSTLVFDVNETLLDLAWLDPIFARTLASSALRPQWFAQMLQLAFVGAITGEYVDFPSAQRAALKMLARRSGHSLGEAEVDQTVEAMSHLPPHPDASPGLSRLARAGWRLVALTNSPLSVVEAQLSNSGLREHFSAVFSADQVRQLKPAAAAYHLVSSRLGIDPGQMCLVAAHAWDVSGAGTAGCQTVFVARGGSVPSPLGAQPSLEVATITELADRLGS